MQATSPLPLTLLDLSFNYDQGSGKNNGSIMQVINNRDSARSITYTYDQVNRVASAQTPTTWGNAFVYDPWGNLLQKNVIKGTAESLAITVDSKNQISAFSYDASGNLTADGMNTLQFNAENQATPPSGTTYSYDGGGRRVLKATKNLYWTDDAFRPLTLTDTSGNAQKDFIFFNGQRVAFVDAATGNAYYYLGDHIGSTSVISSGDGKAISWEADYYPYGGVQLITSNVNNTYRFTGYEFDSETNNNYAVFRYQSSRLGRFLSTDPIAGAIADPQSWNRYSYVSGNPSNNLDPLGLKATPRGGIRDELSYFGMGMGGFGGTIDGLDASSWIIGGLLRSGGALQCPNNACERSVWKTDKAGNGHWQSQRFWAIGNGGYYAVSGAGALYYSANQAGQAASLAAYSAARNNEREYAANIYKDSNGMFSYSDLQEGPVCSSGCRWPPDFDDIPDGTTLVGSAHNHPPLGFGATSFSDGRGDIPTYINLKINGYLSTAPGNRVIMFDYGLFRRWDAGEGVTPICVLQGPAQGLRSCE